MNIKVLQEEITLAANTANTVYDSTRIRIHRGGSAGGEALITIKDTTANTVGSFTMENRTSTIIIKEATHTVEGDAEIKCVPVAYKG